MEKCFEQCRDLRNLSQNRWGYFSWIKTGQQEEGRMVFTVGRGHERAPAESSAATFAAEQAHKAAERGGERVKSVCDSEFLWQ